MVALNSFSPAAMLEVFENDFLESWKVMEVVMDPVFVSVLIVFLRLLAILVGWGKPCTNLLMLLMTLFFIMNTTNMTRPLRALMMSMMKTTTCSLFPMAPVMESATQGSPIPKNNQTTIVNFCLVGWRILNIKKRQYNIHNTYRV